MFSFKTSKFLATAAVMWVGALSSLRLDAAEPFAYKAAQLGTTVKHFLDLNPEFRCEATAKADAGWCTSTRSSYAGFAVKEVRAGFLDGRLSYVEISVIQGPEAAIAIHTFQAIEDALTERHGPALSNGDNTGGLVREIRVWQRADSTIQLSHASNDITHLVGVMILRDDHWKRSVDRQKAKARKDI